MSVKAGMVLAAVALAACGGSGAPDAAQAQVAAARVYDVAGVSIGMDARAAEAALRAAGWQISGYPGHDWTQTVNKAVAYQRHQPFYSPPAGVGGYSGTKGVEEINVELHPTADGGRVAKVTYRAPIAGRTSSAFRSELSKRYGPPTVAQAPLYRDGAIWCSGGDAKCVGTRVPARLPYLIAAYDDGSGGRVKLILSEGSAAEAAWAAQRDAAVKGKIGGAKASF